MSPIDAVFNIAIFILWFRIWNHDDRYVFFNPFLFTVKRYTDKILSFVKPVFVGLRETQTAIVLVLILLALRAGILAMGSPYSLRMGYAAIHSVGRTGNLPTALLVSAVSFGVFLFKLWSLCLVFVRARNSNGLSRAENTFFYACRPFVAAPLETRPILLMAVGFVLVTVMNFINGSLLHGELGVVPLAVVSLISVLLAWVQTLPIIASLLVLVIIGSWISMFTGSHGTRMICDEWLSFLLGPLRKYPIRIGMFDLTPIVAIFAINFITGIMTVILNYSHRMLVR